MLALPSHIKSTYHIGGGDQFRGVRPVLWLVFVNPPMTSGSFQFPNRPGFGVSAPFDFSRSANHRPQLCFDTYFQVLPMRSPSYRIRFPRFRGPTNARPFCYVRQYRGETKKKCWPKAELPRVKTYLALLYLLVPGTSYRYILTAGIGGNLAHSRTHPYIHRTSVPAYQCTSIPVYQYTSIPVYKYTSIPAYQYTSTPVHQYTSIPVYRYNSIPV